MPVTLAANTAFAGEFFEKDGAAIRSYVKKGDRNWPEVSKQTKVNG